MVTPAGSAAESLGPPMNIQDAAMLLDLDDQKPPARDGTTAFSGQLSRETDLLSESNYSLARDTAKAAVAHEDLI